MPSFLAGETNVPASDMTIGTDYLQTNNGSGNNNNSNNGGDSETNFDTNMVIILAALLCALVCALGLNTIVRCALRCGRRVAMEQQTAGLQATAVVGLKKRALRKIPVEVYGPNTSVPGTECPICLGDFADGEKVRVLPKCHHGFHVRCIDTWLSAHPSCPTCRSLIIDHTASDVKAAEDGAQHLNNTETGHVTVRIADERR